MLRAQARVKFGNSRIRSTTVPRKDAYTESQVEFLTDLKPAIASFVRRRLEDGRLLGRGMVIVNIKFADSVRKEELSLTIQNVILEQDS